MTWFKSEGSIYLLRSESRRILERGMERSIGPKSGDCDRLPMMSKGSAPGGFDHGSSIRYCSFNSTGGWPQIRPWV